MKKIQKIKILISFIVLFFLIAFGSSAYGDTISGTVYQSNSSTPIANVGVAAFFDNGTCGNFTTSTLTDANGNYTITGLSTGSYFIFADASHHNVITLNNNAGLPYIDEYYQSSGEGTNLCELADSVDSSTNPTNIDFELTGGYIISGTIMEDDGSTPIVDAYVHVDDQTCGQSWHGGRQTNANGYWCLTVPNGTYYAHTDVRNLHSDYNYVNEWYDGSSGTLICNDAAAINVFGSNQPNINFVLDDGAAISGTLYQSDGSTPITGTGNSIQIGTLQSTENACQGSFTWNESAWTSETNGTYTVIGLPAGSYYVKVTNTVNQNYVSEWYTGGSPDKSDFDCSQAAQVTLSTGGSETLKDFHLDIGATISGTIYQSNGTTPITGDSIQINALILSGPCDGGGAEGPAGSTMSNPADGTYIITGLPGGNFYLQSENMNQANYVNEWYSTSDPPSDPNCNNATQVFVAAEGSATDKHFSLDDAMSITGTVFASDGSTPISGIGVMPVTLIGGTPCDGFNYAPGATTEANGQYTIKGLPFGTYYILTDNYNSSNYVNEWHTGDTDPSDDDCSSAQSITTSETGIDFHLDMGGSISGTIYQSDDSTPITDADIGVQLVPESENPCSSYMQAGWANTNFSGTYTFMGVPAGNYYLVTDNMGQSNYVNEWYTGGSPDKSYFDCSQAQTVTVVADSTTSGTDFDLYAAGSISGTVYSVDGTMPLANIDIGVFAGPCGDTFIGGATTDGSGNYTVQGIIPGDVYVHASPESSRLNYAREWYDGSDGTLICVHADTVPVTAGTDTPGIDFGLKEGPVRGTHMFWVGVDDNVLKSFFKISKKFHHQLKQAVLTLPSGSQVSGDEYSFELINDKISFTTECAADELWLAEFLTVTTGDYGTYTLTLDFDIDGDDSADPEAQEVYTQTLTEVTGMAAVTGVTVEINPDSATDGRVRVSWNPGGQTNKYYRVRIRSTDDSEQYFNSPMYSDISSLDISTDNLRCLTIGETYKLYVLVYDTSFYPNAVMKISVPSWTYSPTFADVQKTAGFSVFSWNGNLALFFNTRAGSRSDIGTNLLITSATVTGPDSYSYSFITSDRYDLSTATRILNGWGHFETGSVTDGEYTLTIAYDYGGGGVDDTEIITKNISFGSATAVASSTMGQVIHPDGTMTFSWDLPVAGQRYDVRIRSTDGTKEYYGGNAGTDGTEISTNLNEMSAMTVGEQYQWFVRSWDATNTAMVQSSSVTFVYDPFLDEDASGATFDASSSNLTNPYLAATVGGRLDYAGFGSKAGAYSYRVAEGVETLDGVESLKVRVQGNGETNPDPDLDSEWSRLWLAQDTDGNVWALQIYDGLEDLYLLDGTKEDAVLFMPATPVVGQIFRTIWGDNTQVLQLNVAVPQLSTGAGPFSGCLKLLEYDGPNSFYDTHYESPEGYTVLTEWEDGPNSTSGWELLPFVLAGDINDDGNVDLADAILALKIIVGLNPGGVHLNADVNGDGKIGLAEVFYIQQKVSDLR